MHHNATVARAESVAQPWVYMATKQRDSSKTYNHLFLDFFHIEEAEMYFRRLMMFGTASAGSMEYLTGTACEGTEPL